MTEPLESIELEKRFHRYVATLVSDAELAEAKDARLTLDYTLEHLGHKMVADWTSWGHRMVEDRYPVYFYEKVPQTWWQHLKKDHFPTWFLRRYPVRYETIKRKRTVKFTRYTEYPDMVVHLPESDHYRYGVARITDTVEEE